MFEINNFVNQQTGASENSNIGVLDQQGAFCVVEYTRDISVDKSTAEAEYYAARMNVRKKQLVCDLSKSGITLQAGAMQWMAGDCQVKTGIKSAGDLIGKAFAGRATGESGIKPEYTGTGIVVCEPTYKHLILTQVRDWDGGLVLDDGMFLACESGIKQTVQTRSNLSSAVAGGKGLFNLKLMGNGVVCLESPYPKRELVEITLQKDVMKVDGSFVVAWSGGLEFTVERSTKSLIGSAASGEGLVNVYRGTGRLWMMPVG